MRPALQRLLTRPSSLNLLRYLTETTVQEAPARRSSKIRSSRNWSCPQCRAYSTAIGIARRHSDPSHELDNPLKPNKFPANVLQVDGQPSSPGIPLSVEWPNISATEQLSNSLSWEDAFTLDQLEFESDLDSKSRTLKRLVDHPALRDDISLWLCLLNFRRRRYGEAAVLTFWNAVRTKRLQLPVDANGDKFWEVFVDFGLKNRVVLDQLVKYATKLLETTGCSWPRLYTRIMNQILMNGDSADAIRWHDKLRRLFSPSPSQFRTMVQTLMHKGGDLESFKQVYIRSTHRNIYATLIPALLAQEDFEGALTWHFLLLKLKDYPANAEIAEPLVQHYSIYHKWLARRVTQSLIVSGASFATHPSMDYTAKKQTSREMMNLAQGKAHHIDPKKYNDNLGARWFATTWVSVDIAINAIQALGIEAIGPLSVQAIALRESSTLGVNQRLHQLNAAGLSIGNSTFVRALTSFASRGDEVNLKALLESDQHPLSLDDWRLQESLLAQYEKSCDWAKYRHTMAVLGIVSNHPIIEEYNLALRTFASQGDKIAILRSIEEMRDRGIEVQPRTLHCVLHMILRPRRSGKGVQSHNIAVGQQNDIELAISILKQIMESNGFVPLASWKEILRRLGMLGRLDELERLCLWLAAWYKPRGTLGRQSVGLSSPRLPDRSHHTVPDQVPTSHLLHPLRILFSSGLQRAIVEWGFNHELLRQSNRSLSGVRSINLYKPSEALPPYTRGIWLIQQLHAQNVAISGVEVRRAVYNRLLTIYGPKVSSVTRNRRIVKYILDEGVQLKDMVQAFDAAWGSRMFNDFDKLTTSIKNGEVMKLTQLGKEEDDEVLEVLDD